MVASELLMISDDKCIKLFYSLIIELVLKNKKNNLKFENFNSDCLNCKVKVLVNELFFYTNRYLSVEKFFFLFKLSKNSEFDRKMWKKNSNFGEATGIYFLRVFCYTNMYMLYNLLPFKIFWDKTRPFGRGVTP